MSWDKQYPHVYAAYDYAHRVVNGEVAACELVRLACQRQINDLDRTDWEFVFDADAAERVCRFVSSMPHVKGSQWAGKTIDLEPWQSFGLTLLFGWLYREDVHGDDGALIARMGSRRFRTYYEEVPRKNAKSTKGAGVGLYLLSQDGEAGAEVYSSATTRDQARIVFSVAQEMARRALMLDVRAHRIIDMESASFFAPLHAQGNTLDGLNIHAAINDELHAWQKRSVYEVIQTATGAREQPLIYNITTAGENVSGICYDLRSYLVKVLRGVVKDETFAGMIYGIDPEDDWTDKSVWAKANPNWGVSVWPREIEGNFLKAREIPSQRNVFKKYHLNVWTSAAEDWMDMQAFMGCQDTKLRIEDFAGEPCWIGIDLASRRDIASLCALFVRNIKGEPNYYAFFKHWTPEAAVQNDANSQYDGWVRMGAMIATGGNVIDIDRIEAETADIANIAKIQEIAMDPGHNSTQYGVHMTQRGFRVIDLRPTVLNFSEPMKWLEAYVIDRRFHYACPVLPWMMANVVVKPRGQMKDNLFPGKAADSRKIDGVIALLMALNRAKAAEGVVDVYKDRELLIV